MDQQLWDAVVNDAQLTESSLKLLIEESSAINKTLKLLSMLCDMISQVESQCYALYKITVIMKYLQNKNPKEFSDLSLEQTNSLKSLKNYTHIDNSGRDLGANVRINVEQLLIFLGDDKKSDLNSITDRLLQTLNSITTVNSEKILQKLRSEISQYNKFLPGPITYEKYTKLDKNPKIDEILYGKLVERVVDTFDDNFPMIKEKIDPTIEHFIIVEGSTFSMFHEILLVLVESLKRSTNERVTNSIVTLLEKFIKSDALISTITEICKSDEKTRIEREEMENKWQITLQIIVSLPNRIANKLSGKISDFFLPETYAKILTLHIARAISFLNFCRKKFAIEPDAKMLSTLISKSVTTLGAQRFDKLIDIMSEWCWENPENIKEFMKKILIHIDRSAMEPIAVLFLTRNDPNIGVARIFENFLANLHWKYVFTIKIPLMSYYKNENLLINLIEYLSINDQSTLTNLILKLLDIWGDRSALNHTSFEQHEYITKLILMAMRKLKDILTRDQRETIKRLLFSGTSAHLESTQSELRGIGMITGEIVIELLNVSNDEPKLKYDYEGMPDKTRKIVEKLRNLEIKSKDFLKREKNLSVGEMKFQSIGERKIYELEIDCGIVKEMEIKTSDFSGVEDEVKSEKTVIEVQEIQRSMVGGRSEENEDLDSDDDLVPYDMSNDKPISEKLRPTYLRDLMENLLNSQSNTDPNIFAESLKVSEELIRSQLPNDDSTFAIELLTILLTLKETSYMENFQLSRFNACIAIVLVYPKESAKYLCNEFHTKIGEYSIKDRLLILDILSESARKLAKIEMTPKIEKSKQTNRKKLISKRLTVAINTSDRNKHETLYDDDFEVFADRNESTIDWEEIVSKRIESNTRRFAHATKRSSTTMNKFNDVAGSFFYPLLYGFRREGTCMCNTPKTFEDQENILLVNYLKTLSIIMMAAENCVIVPKMAKEIMDLAWSLRYHNQAKVRLCVIENTASVVITLPKEGLTTELMELIFEFRAWLSDVSDNGIRGDPDSDCRNLGKNVVALIDSLYSSTLNEL